MVYCERMNEYRVQLDVFQGPLDLLLYLIRRDELDVQDIPTARVAEQYVAYVHLLEEIDPSAAGEFLVMASALVEIKSRALLPTPPIEPLEEAEDPRSLLIRQLLEYKTFKDAAARLGRAADDRARRFVRRPAELPRELQGVELEDVQVWDLLEAFSRVMTAIGKGPGYHQVNYDERPIEWYQAAIVEALEARGLSAFHELFDARAARGEVVATLLGLLELIRQQRVRAQQDRVFGVIYLFLLDEVGPASEQTADESSADGNEEVGNADGQ